MATPGPNAADCHFSRPDGPIDGSRRGRVGLSPLLIWIPLLLSQSFPLSAQVGQVSGRVTEATTGLAVPDVVVEHSASGMSVRTSADGRFSVELPVGPLSLRFTAPGFAEHLVRDTLSGQGLLLDVSLSRRLFDLGQVVATVAGDRQRVELGNAVARLDAGSIVETRVTPSVSTLLQSRIPGVSVQSSSGLAGAGSRIRVRGQSSLLLRNEPIVYIDGIRAEGRPAASTGAGGDRLPISRFDDLNPDDIETIEVVRGPSAAALYGTEAGNGVIRITTRRGRPGPARFQFSTEQGIVQKAVAFPPNHGALDEEGMTCWLVDANDGLCNQVRYVTENPLESPATSPFADAWRRQYRMTVSGGTSTSRYYLAGEWEVEDGILKLADAALDTLRLTRDLEDSFVRPSASRRGSFRANFDQSLTERSHVDVSLGYLSLESRFPLTDLGNVIQDGLGWRVGEDDNPWVEFRPEEIFESNRTQGVERFTGSIQARWTPYDWLTIRSTAGVDDVSTSEVFFQKANRGLDFPPFVVPGSREVDETETRQYSLDMGASATHRLGAVQLRTSIGGQFFRNLWHNTRATGEGLIPGGESVSFGTTTSAGETTEETRTVGTYIEQGVAIGDRLYMAASLRGDDNSSLGKDFDFVVYPKVSASWELSREAVLPVLGRGGPTCACEVPGAGPAYSRTSPTPSSPYDLFPRRRRRPAGAGAPGFARRAIRGLRPELSSEIEVGSDIELLGGRLGATVTYYNKRTEDALAIRRLPPSLCVVGARRENIGVVSNRGWELEVAGVPLAGSDFYLTLSANASFNRNRIEEICVRTEDGTCDASPIRVGSFNWHRVGREPGAFWDNPILGHDRSRRRRSRRPG